MTLLEAGSGTARRTTGADEDSPPGDICLVGMETPNAPKTEAVAAVTDTPADSGQQLAVLLEGIARGDQAAFAEF